MQGLRAGRLEGFRFVPDAERAATARARLLAAANRALRGDVDERVVAAFAASTRRGLRAARRGAESPGTGRATWRASPPGTRPWPRASRCCRSDLLDPPRRERVRRRARRVAGGPRAPGRWRPCSRCAEEAPAGAARGLAFALAEGLGAVTRRSVARQVDALAADDRRELGRLGVSIGRLSLFLPALSNAEAMRLRARLYAVRAASRRTTARLAPRRPSTIPRGPPSSSSRAPTSPPGPASSDSTGSSARPRSSRGCRGTGPSRRRPSSPAFSAVVWRSSGPCSRRSATTSATAASSGARGAAPPRGLAAERITGSDLPRSTAPL